MPKELILSVVVELPDDFFEANRVAMKLSDPWLVLCQALRETGVKHETKTDELEVRAKPGRPRKPRVAVVQDAA